MEWLVPALVGAAAGCLAGLLPGVHVNTLCALALAFAPASPATALALAAAACAHLGTSLLPATYLGLPGEESLLSALPAHRLTLRGRGPDAVRLALRASLTGLLAATALLLPHKWLIAEPGRLLAAVERHLVPILALLLLALPVREVLRGWRPAAAALLVLGFSGGLGWFSAALPVRAWVDVPATPLLPLLTGLFGAPALLASLRSGTPVPAQQPPRRGLRLHASATAVGVASAAVTCLLPGVTSSAALALTRWRDDLHGRAYLCAQGAIAGAHLVFSFGVLWVASRPRTGLAVAAATLWPTAAWTAGAPPAPVAPLLAACLAGAAVGAAATCGLDRVAARWLPAVARWASAGALAGMTLLVAALSGFTGLALYAAATAVGSLPTRLGIGRLHLTACLLVPVLALRLGFTP